ncbi:hypothetical protein [Agromyces archimandritae]|uniref:hypothetical protein n=1 Tax=Agromyces archimandritae TaxID=2781962 RepID=UPI001FD51F76|nr:hypothetical protein [Agromyces archimandritae]
MPPYGSSSSSMVRVLFAPPTTAPMRRITFSTTVSSSGADGRPNIQSTPPSASAKYPSRVMVAWTITVAMVLLSCESMDSSSYANARPRRAA